MLRAIAIDDEPMALEVIRSLSAKIPFLELTAGFTNAYEAMDWLRKDHADLLFLDIKMPDISGIEFLRALSDPPMVVFTTAYSEHAVQSFELDAIDYLLKPFSPSRFLKACTKAQELQTLKSRAMMTSDQPETLSYIFIKSGYGRIRVELADIQYIESLGNYMQFVMPEEKILSRLTMNETEALLPPADFIRIHRSFIVSRTRVTRVEKTSIWIKGKELPVGAGYAQQVEKITGHPR